MRDIELIINSETGFVTTGKNYAIKQENLQRKIIYKFDGEFVDGTAYLCVRKEDGVTGKIQMTKNGSQYELVIKNGLVSNTRSILINIKIVQAGSENNVPIFVSTVSQIKVEDTIQADMDMIDYYPDWHDSIEGLIANKVDKEKGKSLIANSEIERLANVHNYDDTEIKEDISNIEAEQTTQNTAIGNLRTTKADRSEIPDVSAFITRLVNDLEYYYKKTETFTQQEIIQKISEEIAKIIADAPTSFDTLKEIADWISTHQSDASAMNSAIQTNAQDIANIKADYIKSTDYATSDKAGVIKAQDTLGLGVGSTGNLFSTTKTYLGYQELSDGAIIGKGTLENVIAGKGLVKNTDYATNNKAGVFKTSNWLGVDVQTGGVYAGVLTEVQYKNASNSSFIGKGTLENVLTQYTKSDTVKNIVVTTEEPVNPDNNTLYILAKEE